MAKMCQYHTTHSSTFYVSSEIRKVHIQDSPFTLQTLNNGHDNNLHGASIEAD
jgi:hypothetical protein